MIGPGVGMLTGTAFVVLFVASLVPGVVTVVRGWRARAGALETAGAVLRASNLVAFVLAFRLEGVGSTVAIVLGVVLGAWGIWYDVREWRRAKKSADEPAAADSGLPRG